jgi:type IV secretory pathway VirB10-like protein
LEFNHQDLLHKGEEKLKEHIERQAEQQRKEVERREADSAEEVARRNKSQAHEDERAKKEAKDTKRRKRVEERRRQQEKQREAEIAVAAAAAGMEANLERAEKATGLSPVVLGGGALIGIVLVLGLLKMIVPSNTYTHKKNDSLPTSNRETALKEMC